MEYFNVEGYFKRLVNLFYCNLQEYAKPNEDISWCFTQQNSPWFLECFSSLLRTPRHFESREGLRNEVDVIHGKIVYICLTSISRVIWQHFMFTLTFYNMCSFTLNNILNSTFYNTEPKLYYKYIITNVNVFIPTHNNKPKYK